MATRFPLVLGFVVALAGPVAADDPKTKDVAVDRAVKDGQAYLTAVFRRVVAGGLVPPGLLDPVPGGGMNTGALWAGGLALIESGVPANDPVVVGLARLARESAIATDSTYHLSLLIMFLDRVGMAADEPLIQFLTLRLLSGQCADGSWTYQCGGLGLDPVQQRALYADLYRGAKLATPESSKAPPKKQARPRDDLDDAPKAPKKEAPASVAPPPPKEEKPKGLHPALEKYDRYVRAQPRGSGAQVANMPAMTGDHSNTQFATVALWCGRRHFVNVTDALYALNKHYRDRAGAGGGWGYSTVVNDSSPAMTCAGLMGLAMGFGAKDLKDGADKDARIDADAVSRDPVVQGALKYVGDFIAASHAGGGAAADDLSRNLYFMWSLERVGMVYGLTTIGKVNWYEWGSRLLVRTQNRDGSWPSDGFHSGTTEVATAFALLFLSRANLAEDLSHKLRGTVRDPGTSKLRSPGDLKDMLDKAGKPSAEPGTGPVTPKADPATPAGSDQAKALAAALIAATGAKRDELLTRYRDSRGTEYLDALLLAVGQLAGEAKTQARDALAGRLGRMTAHTLNTFMTDPDPELRRAAALAAGSKGKDRMSEFADMLAKLTADKERFVAQAARASLKALTGQDFGPEPTAGPEERAKASAAWKEWWARAKPR